MNKNKYFRKLKRIETPLAYRMKISDDWILEGLSYEEKIYVIRAYEESRDSKNLIPHETVKAQFSKWLTK